MPEGDTVWRTARSLDRALSGRVLTRGQLRVPQHATAHLAGERVESTVARGKHLLTRVGDHTLHTHLRMEGSWHLYRPGSGWRRPGHQARVVLATAEWQAVGFSLGAVDLLSRGAEHEVVGHLGPDLLGPDWDEGAALARLRADPQRPVGEALLDQRNLAGIGNLYENEVLFLSGVRPARPVGEVDDLAGVVRRARRMLEANKERAEQTFTGELGRGRRTWVYRRERQPCRRCATPVEVAMHGAAGRERATYWCPVCQPD